MKPIISSSDFCRCYLHTSLAEYFDGRWANGEEKPYVDHKSGKDQQADRFVAKQPYVFSEQNAKKAVFNLRKTSEMPFHLIKVRQTFVPLNT